jgi:hypothetical protein
MQPEFAAIFAAAECISKARQIARLRYYISTAERRVCGNCTWWMKGRACPAEKNVNGFSRGPSCGSTACGKFDLEPHTTETKRRLESELEAMMNGGVRWKTSDREPSA